MRPLGKVPGAGNADKVGGIAAGSFARADRWILVQGTAALRR